MVRFLFGVRVTTRLGSEIWQTDGIDEAVDFKSE